MCRVQIYSPSRRMPTFKHFFSRQYWHWLRWCWSIGQVLLARHVYVKFLRTLLLKKTFASFAGELTIVLAARFVPANNTFYMLLTLSRILAALVASRTWCGRGSWLTGGLRRCGAADRRLLLLPRRLSCWIGAARRSSGHVFLRISPDANYHCHISGPKSAFKRTGRSDIGAGKWKSWTNGSANSNRSTQSHREKSRSRKWSIHQNTGVDRKAPDQDMQLSGGQFQVNCSQPFGNPSRREKAIPDVMKKNSGFLKKYRNKKSSHWSKKNSFLVDRRSKCCAK